MNMSKEDEVDIMFGQMLVQVKDMFGILGELLRTSIEFEQAKVRGDLKAIAEITRQQEALLKKSQETRQEMEAFEAALAGCAP